METMPSTHLSLHYHIIFSTKDRVPIIASEWRHRLHAYIGGVVRNIGGIPEAVGGVDDHIHVLGLRATHCLADAVRDLKAVSSRWVHEQISVADFAWQEGYGAFTVSASQRMQVLNYIPRQEEHHRNERSKTNTSNSCNGVAWNTMTDIYGDGSAAPPGADMRWRAVPVVCHHRLISKRPSGLGSGHNCKLNPAPIRRPHTRGRHTRGPHTRGRRNLSIKPLRGLRRYERRAPAPRPLPRNFSERFRARFWRSPK